MSLLPLFQACDHSALGHAMRNSPWLFPWIETLHLLALALLGGSVLIVDLRLFGAVLKREPIPSLSRELEPWMIGGLAAMLVSGILLFFSEALKLYGNGAFRAKMVFLALAVAYTFTARRRVVFGERPLSRTRTRVTALVSLILWAGVGLCGRAIGFR